MYVRVNLVTTEPAKLDASIDHARDTVAPLVESLPGNRGMIVAVNRETGRATVATIWDDLDALRASESRVAGVRSEAGRIAGGTPQVQILEVVERHVRTDPAAGCWQRATTLELEPENIESVVDTFRSSTLPALDSMAGFCAAVLQVDREAGRGVAIVTWRDRASMAASDERARSLRQEVADKAHGTVLSVEEREVVFATFH